MARNVYARHTRITEHICWGIHAEIVMSIHFDLGPQKGHETGQCPWCSPFHFVVPVGDNEDPGPDQGSTLESLNLSYLGGMFL